MFFAAVDVLFTIAWLAWVDSVVVVGGMESLAGGADCVGWAQDERQNARVRISPMSAMR